MLRAAVAKTADSRHICPEEGAYCMNYSRTVQLLETFCLLTTFHFRLSINWHMDIQTGFV